MCKYYFLLFLILPFFLQAQTTSAGFSTEVNITVSTADFTGSVDKLNAFIRASNAVVQNRNDNRKSVEITLLVSDMAVHGFEDFADSLGIIASKKISAINNEEKINDIQGELNYLKQSKASYEDLIQKIDVKSEKYTTYWSEARSIDEKIFNKERELRLMTKKSNIFIANLKIEDALSIPERTDIAYVNMPGVEYAFLKIENPKAGISSNDYSGYFLKYLFTRGKSFVELGAFKSNQAVTDSMQWSEFFVIGFGQDFYSRHFGGGNQSYLNLYSGYVIGYAYISNKSGKEDVFYLSPTIGLELYKNKYILWDSKVSYFIPFSYNKNLRGLSYGTSFNFMF